MANPDFMQLAVDEAYDGIKNGHGGPFGAVIVKDDNVLGRAHNTVLRDNDPTRHAEVTVISSVARGLASYDLSGCEIYTSTEPCPMCFSAIHWARIERVIFGTRIEDVMKRGFNELLIPAEKMGEISGSALIIEPDFQRKACLELLEFWDDLPDKRTY